MSDKSNTERIDILEKRVNELKEQIANAANPRIFAKAILTLLLVGTFFLLWKARNTLKWLTLACIAWLLFGTTVRNICTATGEFISNTWSEMRANGKIDDEHERQLERLKAETDAVNSKVKVEAAAHVSTTRAEADARTQVINAEETAKQAEWERSQAERRNDAVNDAIRGGTWNVNTPVETAAPRSPKFERPQHQQGPKVDVRSEGFQPKIERTVNGNTTKVVVKF